MSRFFPTVERVAEARKVLATGNFCELDSLMGVSDLELPHEHDLPALVEEFKALAAELGLGDGDESGFVVLVPVSVHGIVHTTPVLVDMEYVELSFTSHPEFGAGAIPGEVLVENPRLVADVREELLGVIATWHNTEGLEE
jgi:hypothetical protein